MKGAKKARSNRKKEKGSENEPSDVGISRLFFRVEFFIIGNYNDKHKSHFAEVNVCV